MKSIITCLLALSVSLHAVETISKRASEIDPRAKEHPEIDFVFTDKKGKPQDLQNASVDLSVNTLFPGLRRQSDLNSTPAPPKEKLT